MSHILRTRFKKEIVAEFLPPSRKTKKNRVVFICDGMPGIPRKQGLMHFLSKKGFWVIYPRYRGAWESGGVFLRKSPHLDILDIIGELKKEVKEVTHGKRFRINPKEIFVIGGSFGGPAAILCSMDSRVKKVVANCPVVDWKILKLAERVETSNKSYVSYIHAAFGNAYRLSQKEWDKLKTGKFYNPAAYIKQLDPKKIIMFHAKDDPVVPWRSVHAFSKKSKVPLKSLQKGGHLSTEFIVTKYWKQIAKFFRV